MIGMKIGWGDSFIPDFVYNVWWILVFFSITANGEEKYVFSKKIRGGMIIICVLSFSVVYMTMLLFCTPKGYIECPSIGARYLLPLLLPFCVALHGNRIKISGGVSDELFIWGADLCQMIALVYMYVGYLER